MSMIRSGILNIRLSAINIKCRFNLLEPQTFYPFLRALESLSRFSTNKTYERRTCVRLILGFYAIQLSHSSNFVHYLYSTGRSYSFPEFVHSYLMGIAIRSESNNKLAGLTRGNLEPSFDLSLVIESLKCDDYALVYQLLQGTVFEHLVRGKDHAARIVKLDLLVADIDDYIIGLADGFDADSPDFQYEIVSNVLSDLPTILYYTDRMPVINHRFTLSDSTNYSIYRYRNYKQPGPTYIAPQNTFDGVGLPSLTQHASFLVIFSPEFDSARELVGGDIVIDTTVFVPFEAWKAYLSFNIERFSSSKQTNQSRGGKSRNSQSSTHASVEVTGNSENIIGNFSLSGDSIILHSDSEYYKLFTSYRGLELKVYDIGDLSYDNLQCLGLA
jgi:hypothetical protein